MSKIFNVDVLPEDSVVNVPISGAFMARLMQLLLAHADNDYMNVIKSLKELENREPETAKEYHLLTILILIKGIEDAAKEQGLIVTKEFDPEKFQGDGPGS